MSGWPFIPDLKGSVQLWPMDLDEGADAAIRVGTGHNRENGKQQDMRQLVKFAFGAPRIGDCCELREEMFESFQGNLRMIRLPHIDSGFFDLRNPSFVVAPQIPRYRC